MYHDRDPYAIRKRDKQEAKKEAKLQKRANRKAERKRRREERKNRKKKPILYPKILHFIPFFRPVPGPPVYSFSNPLHHMQRLDRDQIQTSIEAAQALSLFPLSSRKTKSGPCTILVKNTELNQKVLVQFTQIMKRIRKEDKKRVQQYAKSFYKSFQTRGKSPHLWPRTSFVHPFKIENYSMASWVKLIVEKYKEDDGKNAGNKNGDGNDIIAPCQGLDVVYEATKLSHFVSFLYVVDPQSTLYHLNYSSLKCFDKIIDSSQRKGTDMNLAIQEEYGIGGQEGKEDGASDGASSSSSEEDDDDSDSSGEEKGEEEGAAEKEEEEEVPPAPKVFVPNVPAFDMQLYSALQKERSKCVKLFEKSMIECIHAYADKQASIFRAETRLDTFIDERNWYRDSATFKDKPSSEYIARPWSEKTKPIMDARMKAQRKKNNKENNNQLNTGKYEGKYGVPGGGQAWGDDYDRSRSLLNARVLKPSQDGNVLKLDDRRR